MKVSVSDGLLNSKIYFGHMSVGYNILSGIDGLQKVNFSLEKLMVREISTTDSPDNNAIYHSKIGGNGFPYKKCDNFKDFLIQNDFGNKIDIALFKFCYVDFNNQTDVDKLFDYYINTINIVQNKFPNLKIIHVTVPLRAHAWGLKGFIKNIIKKDSQNIKRNEFNNLLLEKYSNEFIFDLAKSESTYPDGERELFKDQGKDYYALIEEYTYDGGHLNDLGKKNAASEFISFLSTVSEQNK